MKQTYFTIHLFKLGLPLFALSFFQISNAQQSKTDSLISKTIQIRNNLYFYEPFPQDIGSYLLQLGGSFTLLPIPVVENEYPSPAIDLQYKHGILKNVSIVGSFSTNYFTNLLHAGMQWNTNYDRFSFGIAPHFGGFTGFISVEGQFDDNSAYGIFFLPILRFGYRFDDLSISMSLATSYIFKSESKVSGLQAPGPEHTWNDIFLTIAVEQPFLKQQHLSIGLSLTYARSPYQSWLLFNTIDQYLFVPEFFFSFQL